MKRYLKINLLIIPVMLLVLGIGSAGAVLFVQCPGDLNNDAVPDQYMLDGNGVPTAVPNPDFDANVVCRHITGGDGYATMADDSSLYMFGFGDYTGNSNLAAVVMENGLRAQSPAPTIKLREGQNFYLTLTNVGMVNRPDLFDAHTVHWHGFPSAAPIFDGLPEPSPAPNMGGSFTYYYNVAVPGNYFYHCHVEAAEHMQMGMIGNLWVYPGQSYLPDGTVLGGYVHSNDGDVDAPPYGDFPGPGDLDLNANGVFDEGAHDKYVYNDGDGSTRYDVEYPIQLTGFDSVFHHASEGIAALPFANMEDDYGMINGRGYPDTVDPNPIVNQEGFASQPVPTIIEASAGEIVLLRVSNVSTTDIWAVTTTLGKPMKVIGRGAAILRGPDPDGAGPLLGKDTSFEVNVLNVGGGQAYDVFIDTTGITPGTYHLYTSNLQFLSNGDETRGGIMTEIRIN